MSQTVDFWALVTGGGCERCIDYLFALMYCSSPLPLSNLRLERGEKQSALRPLSIACDGEGAGG